MPDTTTPASQTTTDQHRRTGMSGRHIGGALRHAFLSAAIGALTIVTATAFFFGLRANERVQHTFRIDVPASGTRVYTQPLELTRLQTLTTKELGDALNRVGYRKVSAEPTPGTYLVKSTRAGNRNVVIHTRGFAFSDAVEPPARIELSFRGRHIQQIQRDGKIVEGSVRIDPTVVGTAVLREFRDSRPVRLQNVPVSLIDTLLAVEDRSFYDHIGIDFSGIVRATIANLRAGRVRQGASTITQQFIRGRYLGNERTFSRKLNEVFMAIALERHYSKEQILEGYINEVYLGQNGNRAIHGFARASEYYFSKPLDTLRLEEMALMVGMVRGPSMYNPRRYPDRARKRRDLALDLLDNHADNYASALVSAARATDLGVTRNIPDPVTSPSFSNLVSEQVTQLFGDAVDHRQKLSVFSTLDPRVQGIAENALSETLDRIEAENEDIPENSLEGAIVVVGVTDGRIHAAVGGRRSGYAGFNRALEARRQIGSLIKPAIFLTALENSDRYSLTSTVEDYFFQIPGRKDQIWRPQNFDGREHGEVTLIRALAGSYNLASARLGLDVGVQSVHNTVQRLGVPTDNSPYPALLLGAISLTPLEVAQMYQTIANQGKRIPLHTVRNVRQEGDGKIFPIPLTEEVMIERQPSRNIIRALQEVFVSGTARSASEHFSPSLRLAGKTGTTNRLRDSWFAGFSGNLLTVVWVGRDDNQPAGVTGATGALPVWSRVMSHLTLSPVVKVNTPTRAKPVLVDKPEPCDPSSAPHVAGLADPKCTVTAAPDASDRQNPSTPGG